MTGSYINPQFSAIVSVIIPTFNCAKYICAAIDSVLHQTYQDFEIIIVDDGSTDNTKEILKSYLKQEPQRIKYYFQNNKGHSSARNVALNKSAGRYVAFLDADDMWLPSRLEESIKGMESSGDIGLVHADTIVIAENGRLIASRNKDKRFLSGYIFKHLFLRQANISMPTVLLKKECLGRVGLFDESLNGSGCEDRELWLRVSRKYKIKYIDKKLAYYRIRPESSSRNIKKMMEARYYVIDKFFPKKSGVNFLRNKALAKIHQEAGDGLLYEHKYKQSGENYCISIYFWPFSIWVWINLIKAIFKIKINYE